MTDVFVDSVFFGSVKDPQQFIDNLRQERRSQQLPSELNVRYDDASDVVYLNLAHGRVRRPLIVVRDGQSALTPELISKLEANEISWDDLVRLGVIEYLDANEEEDMLIAWTAEDITPAHTHMEVSPLAIFSLATSLVPFANYCYPYRAHGGSKAQKQALGMYVANYGVRMDTDVNLLWYPQAPLVRSVMYDITKQDLHPAGQNVVVAVLSYEGYNMDDAIILNKASIERGFGRSSFFRPYGSEELRYSGGLVDEIVVPDKEVVGYRSEEDYKLLEDDGIIHVEAKVADDDVLIGKTSPPRFLSGMNEYTLGQASHREASTVVRHNEGGVVDMVTLTENYEGNKFVQVRIRDMREPEIGDKFASRHGQKGIVGMIYPQADMPFTTSGMIPDVIFSPHSIPTRMTVSHLLELLGGKVAALSGNVLDATGFEAEPEADMRAQLLKLGFSEKGAETMYNGLTGEKFKVKIYVGNQYYLKLKHMVKGKIQSRARGPIALLTRQPTEGKAKEGGLRLGEMEKDTFIAHGASTLLQERFDADKTVMPVSDETGEMGYHDAIRNRIVFPASGENADFSHVHMSYAFKLLLDEFRAMCIDPRLAVVDQFKLGRVKEEEDN